MIDYTIKKLLYTKKGVIEIVKLPIDGKHLCAAALKRLGRNE